MTTAAALAPPADKRDEFPRHISRQLVVDSSIADMQ